MMAKLVGHTFAPIDRRTHEHRVGPRLVAAPNRAIWSAGCPVVVVTAATIASQELAAMLVYLLA